MNSCFCLIKFEPILESNVPKFFYQFFFTIHYQHCWVFFWGGLRIRKNETKQLLHQSSNIAQTKQQTQVTVLFQATLLLRLSFFEKKVHESKQANCCFLFFFVEVALEQTLLTSSFFQVFSFARRKGKRQGDENNLWKWFCLDLFFLKAFFPFTQKIKWGNSCLTIYLKRREQCSPEGKFFYLYIARSRKN